MFSDLRVIVRSHPRALSVFGICVVEGLDFLLRLRLRGTIGVAQLALDAVLIVSLGFCDGFSAVSRVRSAWVRVLERYKSINPPRSAR